MQLDDFNQGLCQFLDAAPTPFHAVAALRTELLAQGYTELLETDDWTLRAKGSYFVTRNASALIAFRLGTGALAEQGLRMVGAHTDSPCLRLKPNALYTQSGYCQLGVEVYGGALLNPWFDRDLSLAGRVTLRLANGSLSNRLVDLARPVALIPSLAIHLDRDANKQRNINEQTYLPALISRQQDTDFDLDAELLQALRAQEPEVNTATIVASELSLYDTQKAALVGWNGEFIAAARLDNLLSCYTGLRALLDAEQAQTQLLVCNDHEEVGSGSSAGARGPFLMSVLERLCGNPANYTRALQNSVLVSTDNAHGVHPNFPDKHDGHHGPLLNAGPAIKINHNQSYASNSATIAVFEDAARRANVTTQCFVTRGDLRCGSTIGPLTATVIGVPTVDVGVPTFAMHSIRELAGSRDAHSLYRALRVFYATPAVAIT